MLFDWLITGQIMPSIRPRLCRAQACGEEGQNTSARRQDWRTLIDSIPADTIRDLRDRALIATLTYSFARIGAALKMKVEDLQSKGSGWLIHLQEKGGKQHTMPCHHLLAEVLHAYIAAAGIADDRKGWLFRTSPGHKAAVLTGRPMDQSAAWLMIRRRAAAAGIWRRSVTIR